MKNSLRKISKTARKSELTWRYGFNLIPSISYKFGPHKTSNSNIENILENLNKDGVAVTSINSLFGENSCFKELEAEVTELISNWEDKLQALRLESNKENSIGKKTYSVELLGSKPYINPQSIFARFALQEALLDIANAYLGMYSKLRYYNVWYTLPTETAPRESQLWHYDREDNYMLKIFVYLKDVDENTGPFTYAPKTHRKGSLWALTPPYSLEGHIQRSTDEQMAEVVPKDEWKQLIGKKGTIVFADTRGYHKGGEAKTNERLVYTCMFTSPASESQDLLTYPNNECFTELSYKQKLALKLPK